MIKPRIGIFGVGEMGAAVGRKLVESGYSVKVDVTGRSERSIKRVKDYNLSTTTTIKLLTSSDVLLSIVPPEKAFVVATTVANQLSGLENKPLYVDCNAVSPNTIQKIYELFQERNLNFLDACIIGNPPTQTNNPTFYASGTEENIDTFKQLHDQGQGLNIKVAGQNVGAASALKMSYSGIHKGIFAIVSAMTIAAEKHGALDGLLGELACSGIPQLEKAKNLTNFLGPRAYRFGFEMREISEFAGHEDAEGSIYNGIANFYDRIAMDKNNNTTGEWSVLEDVSKKANSK
ncbi:Y7SR [Acrasis kona]|uniref:Y7SR n=1 Tax=Acrasis kona TaxID=1008807 RepID=A0AAW2YJ44_9EUKA